MQIYQIKTINGGFKGLETSFTEERVEPNGRKFVDDVTKEKNDPIHLALDKPIKALRKYLLDICGIINDHMDQTEIDYNIAETEIISICMTKTLLVIEGEKEWLNNKKFKLKTPKIEQKDNYVNYDAVMQLIDEIKKEAGIYMKGKARVTDEEAAVRFITSGKDKSMTADEYNNMSDDEKLAYHKKIIEDQFGGIVMTQEDVLDDDSAQEDQIVDLKKLA